MNKVDDSIGSFKTPRGIRKGSGRKGDEGNLCPKRSLVKRAGCKKKGNGSTRTTKVPSQTTKHTTTATSKTQTYSIKPRQSTKRLGAVKNTLQLQSCANGATHRTQYAIVTVSYAANASPIQVIGTCEQTWTQACHHYSSALRYHPEWSTLSCPQSAATHSRPHGDTPCRSNYDKQHDGRDWNFRPGDLKCHRDEYPPAYFLQNTDEAWIEGGVEPAAGRPYKGQVIRLLPGGQNTGAASMWKSACFRPVLSPQRLNNADFMRLFESMTDGSKLDDTNSNIIGKAILGSATVSHRPEFSIGAWRHIPLPNDGLDVNTCRLTSKARRDPGFALFTFDPYYGGNPPPYDYTAPYVRGSNGD